MNAYVKTPHIARARFYKELAPSKKKKKFKKSEEWRVVSQWKSWHKLTFCVLAVLGWKPNTIRAQRARIHRQITLFHYSILRRHPPSSRPSFLPLIPLCPTRLSRKGGGGNVSVLWRGAMKTWVTEWHFDSLTSGSYCKCKYVHLNPIYTSRGF